VSILTINRDMLGQFWDWHTSYASSSSQFCFSFSSSQNPFFFPHSTKPVSEKWWSRTHSPLDRREIWAPGLEFILEHYHHWELWIHVGAKRNTLCIVDFSFPIETPNCLSKTLILDSLTVGLLWNFDMLFAFHLVTSSPLGFVKKYLKMEK